MLPNRESGPQNHPIAKVAVLVSAGALRSMGGRSDFDSGAGSDGLIVAFSFIAVRRIPAMTIAVMVKGRATRASVARTAWAVSFAMAC
jgi:hypothetical protein